MERCKLKFNQIETPCYIIDKEVYDRNRGQLQTAFESFWGKKIMLGYSIKTNHLPFMINLAKRDGWLAEVVSEDEYQLALDLGYKENEIIYNGPQKKDHVLYACKKGSIVNLDNLQEVAMVCNSLTEDEKKNCCIGLRINFDLEKECPGETTSGEVPGRFGICLENGDVHKAVIMLAKAGIKVKGIHMHASTKSRSIDVFRALAKKAGEIVHEIPLLDIEYIDIGGGFFGGNYFPGKPSILEYAKIVCNTLKESINSNEVTLILEPGAAITATAADYCVSVCNIRSIRGKRIVTVDGTCLHINAFMHPKRETPFTLIGGGENIEEEQIIGGCTCMEMDRFYPRNLNDEICMESRLLFHCAGAYTMTHNSCFINNPPNIYVHEEDSYEIVRKKDYKLMQM